MATEQQASDRPLSDVLEGHRFAMVTTSTPQGLTSRPLTLLEQEDSTLRFLVSTETPWVQELTEPVASVQVSFAAPDRNEFVALQGHARLVRDRAAVERLWNPAAAAFFSGPDDPVAAVLEAEVHDGEWWDGPSSKVGQAVAFAKKALTGDEPGAHGRVEPSA